MEIFNAGADKFSIGFEEGGVPYYNTDVLNSQDNAQLWGIPSIYRNYNMILSGCLVDELTLGGTIKITEGFVMIQNLVYKVPAYTGTYPVELKANDPVVQQRDFKSGETHDATYTYTVSWVTNLTTATATNFPIQFKPFCNQRVDNYNENMGKILGELREINVTKNTRTKTDTTKTIIGGEVSIVDSGLLAGWEQVVDARVTIPTENTIFTALGSNAGSSNRNITKSNLPPHRHETHNGVNGSTINISAVGNHFHGAGTYNANAGSAATHKHTVKGKTIKYSGGGSAVEALGYAGTQPDGAFKTGSPANTDDGNHSHDIGGLSGDSGNHSHTASGATGYGLFTSSTQLPFSLLQPSVFVLRLKFVGYPQMFNHTSTFGTIF